LIPGSSGVSPETLAAWNQHDAWHRHKDKGTLSPGSVSEAVCLNATCSVEIVR